jgi:hypothetical protein
MISYFFGEENVGKEMPFISSKDIKKENIKKENIKTIPPKESLSAKQYFNLPENKNKILEIRSNSGFWRFENSGTKFSFYDNNHYIITQSYDHAESIKGARTYFMTNGSIIEVWFEDNIVHLNFINNIELTSSRAKWIDI